MDKHTQQSIKKNFEYFTNNQNEIVENHLNEYVVIKNQKICGYYETEEKAFDSMIGEELETFIVQKCQSPGTDIANYYNNTVAFA
jgi:hypothetical protein